MRIAIFGAGGIGGYLGGRLTQAGEEVVLIARGEHLQAIRDRGLKVDSIKGDFVARPSLVTSDPKNVGFVDVIILGVKSWQVVDAAEAMRPMIGPNTFVILQIFPKPFCLPIRKLTCLPIFFKKIWCHNGIMFLALHK